MSARRGPFEARADDFAWCEEVIRRNSRSFYQAFALLPREKSQGVFAVYAFCRAADDAVDRDRSRAQLEALERKLERLVAGDAPDEPLWRALEAVFDRFALDDLPFFDMLEGQRRDLAFRQPETMDELEEYAYYVAGTVGLMLLPLLRASSPAPTRLAAEAIDLGVAMQLTNILRDVGEDRDAGRVYLPVQVLEEAKCSAGDLAAREASPAFVRAWEAVARRSEELYRPLERDIVQLDADSRLPTLGSLLLYRGILDAVRADGYACLVRRSAVPQKRAAALMAEARALLEGAQERGYARGTRAVPASAETPAAALASSSEGR